MEQNTECKIFIEPFFQCCCKCQNQVKLIHSCNEENHNNHICFTNAGYGCYIADDPNELPKVFVPISYHSVGCEMYKPRNEKV